MAAHVHQRTTCRLCDSADLECVLELAPIPLAEKYVDAPSEQPGDLFPVDLSMCRDCGHVQLLDVIDPDLLWDDYTYHSGQTRGIVEHFEAVAEEVVRTRHPAADGLVVDIGSNDGTLLKAFQKRGLRVLGVDPARELAAKANANGVETLCDFMTVEQAQRIRADYGPAAVVTAFNSFAHADNLHDMTAAIAHLLDQRGVFLFEVQYLLDIVDRMLLGTIFHEHLSHHSLTPLQAFLARHGLEVIDVQRVTIQHGSLIGTVQHQGGPAEASPAVQQLLELEAERRLTDPATLRGFAKRLAGLQAEVAALVESWRNTGARVAAYGAARSGPTLINQFGLADVIEYVLDDHPQKVNKFTPGHQFPVLPTRELERRQPDYVVILAWIHAKKIIAQHADFLRKGGRFVTCCPEVRVIGWEDVSSDG